MPLYNPLKSPLGAHVQKAAYGPLIVMALGSVHNAFDGAKSITWPSGSGLGPGNLDFFGPPNARIMGLPASKALRKRRPYKSKFHK